MGIVLGSNFTVETALPLDDRQTVADLTARDAINALRRYVGMIVYVESEETNYQLIGGVDNADWRELSGSGGGGIISVADLVERDAIIADQRYEGLACYVQATQTYYGLIGGIENTDWQIIFLGNALFSDDVGSLVLSARNIDNAPEGTLPCVGDTLYLATDYPDLAYHCWNATQSKWKFGGTGTYPTGSFYTPKMGGAFIRIANNGAGYDPNSAARTASNTGGVTGDAVGSFQGHAFQTHTHIQNAHSHKMENVLYDTVGSGAVLGARFNAAGSEFTQNTTAVNQNAAATGANSQASTGETRPVNIYFNCFIRYKPSGKGEKGDQGVPGEGIKIVADIVARDAIPSLERTIGMTVTVLDDGNGDQVDYWLVGGIVNANWELKTAESKITVSNTQVITSSDIVVIDNTKSRQRIKIKGDLGTAYSSLPAGAIDGQELYLQGVSDDEPVILEAWSTADLGGAQSITFTKNVMKYFIWDHGQSLWVMVGG